MSHWLNRRSNNHENIKKTLTTERGGEEGNLTLNVRDYRIFTPKSNPGFYPKVNQTSSMLCQFALKHMPSLPHGGCAYVFAKRDGKRVTLVIERKSDIIWYVILF